MNKETTISAFDLTSKLVGRFTVAQLPSKETNAVRRRTFQLAFHPIETSSLCRPHALVDDKVRLGRAS
jgi:hypothetical protein